MFHPPKTIEATLFARLPDHLRSESGTNAWLAQQPAGHSTHSLLEGPVPDRHSNLFCVDVLWGRIFKVDANGEFTLFTKYEGEPNGLKIGADGHFYVADFRNGILKIDPQTKAVSVLVDRHRLERLKAVNDLTFARNGDLYFTDQGLTGLHDPTGRLFRLRRDGTLDCVLNNVPSPNGVVVHPNQQVVFVAATRANAVWRVPLLADGSAVKVGTFVQLSGGVGPDGLAIDEQGRLAVAHFGLGCVWLFSPRGEPELRINVPEGEKTTNVAFGGKNGKTLFITEADTGSIYCVEL